MSDYHDFFIVIRTVFFAISVCSALLATASPHEVVYVSINTIIFPK